MSGQGSAISQMTIYSVNAAPCRMLAWGKSPLNVKNCVSPTGLDHREQRDCLLGSLSQDRTSVRRPEGQKCLSDYQMSQMWHTSACRVQTNPFGNLGSLGGWTLGSTNVKGGLHLVLTRSPKNYKLLCTSSQEPILVRGITSVYGQRCSRSSSKSLGFFNLCLVPKPHNHWRPILGLSNQTFRRPSGPPSNNGSVLPE